MSKKPVLRQDDPEQSKRFLEAAKAAGADETEKGAKRAFKAVVKPRALHRADQQKIDEGIKALTELADKQSAAIKRMRKLVK